MSQAPRLLWPTTPEEALLELDHIGAAGPWPGALGSPPRTGRRRLPGPDRVALKWPEPVPPAVDSLDPDKGLTAAGSVGKGRIVFGPLDALLGRVDQLGDAGAAAAEAAAAAETGAAAAEAAAAAAGVAAAAEAIRFGSALSVPSCWDAGGHLLPLDERTLLMAVVNVTDDSFYAESRITSPARLDQALERAAEEGADLIDIGGESTRPGAEPVPDEVQLERVVPAIERAVTITGLPVSVDTTRVGVARAALDAGASVVNDISAGTVDPDLIPLVAERGAGLVLMHRMGESATMQDAPHYDDLCGEIHAFLSTRAGAAVEAGVGATRIAIDPGLGFGKRRQHNFELYRRVAEFHSLGYPLLLGPSRKRHTSGAPDRPAGERLMGTAAACTLLAWQGVQILRVHDVGEMRRTLETADEIRGAIIEDRVS